MAYEYSALIRRVVDGDTIDIYVNVSGTKPPGVTIDDVDAGEDRGLGIKIAKCAIYIKARVTIDSIDAPEVNTSDSREKQYGLRAAQRVRELLPEGSWAKMHSKGFSVARGASVDFDLGGNETLAQKLISEKLAVPYSGGGKAAVAALHKANWDALEGKAPRAKKRAAK